MRWKEALGIAKNQTLPERVINFVVTIGIGLLLLAFVSSCVSSLDDPPTGGCDWATGYCEDPYYEDPYPGYDDTADQDCSDVDGPVYVGDNDPDGLDRDGDGWGCE